MNLDLIKFWKYFQYFQAVLLAVLPRFVIITVDVKD